MNVGCAVVESHGVFGWAASGAWDLVRSVLFAIDSVNSEITGNKWFGLSGLKDIVCWDPYVMLPAEDCDDEEWEGEGNSGDTPETRPYGTNFGSGTHNDAQKPSNFGPGRTVVPTSFQGSATNVISLHETKGNITKMNAPKKHMLVFKSQLMGSGEPTALDCDYLDPYGEGYRGQVHVAADGSPCLPWPKDWHGGNKPGTCLLPGMCFTFWKEGFYEARQRVTDTERTDL